MLKKILVFSCVATLLYSCNPSSNNVVPNNPITADSICGFLVSMKSVGIGPDSTIYTEIASALFKNNPTDTNYVAVGMVKANDDSLILTQFGYMALVNGMDTGAHWSVTQGNSQLPSFNYNYSIPYPIYNINFPDTIHISNGFSFPCSFSNTDSVLVSIGTDTVGSTIYRMFSPNVTAISFTPIQMNNLQVTNAGLTVIIYKGSIQTYNYKHFLFEKEIQLTAGKTIFVP